MKRLLGGIAALAALVLIVAHLRLPHSMQQRTLARPSDRDFPDVMVSMPNGTISVNQASAADLERLPGVGAVLAARIIEEREQNGPFHYPQDLLSVSGIGEKTLQRLLEHIRLD